MGIFLNSKAGKLAAASALALQAAAFIVMAGPATPAEAALWDADSATFTFQSQAELKAMASGADGQMGTKGTWPSATSTATGEKTSVKAKKVKTVVIASGIARIPASTFCNQSFQSLYLPASVKKIGAYAFHDCASLASADLTGAKTLGNFSFDGCTSLKTLNAPKATTLGYGAFFGCKKLTEADLGPVKKIGYIAFSNCSKLKTLVVSGTKLASVGAGALYTGKGKKLVVKAPASKLQEYEALIEKGNATTEQNCATVRKSKVTLQALGTEELTALQDRIAEASQLASEKTDVPLVSETAAEAEEEENAQESSAAKNSAKKSGLVTKKGATYLYKAGKMVKGKKASYKGKYYYLGSSGKALKGWFIKKGKLYYGKKTGELLASTSKQGIKFSSKAQAKDDYATQTKMYAMKIVSKVTKKSWSKAKKFTVLRQWTRTHGRWSMKAAYTDMSKRGWVQRQALKCFKGPWVHCIGGACEMAVFAYELGYTPTVKAINGYHGACYVNGKRYDWNNPNLSLKGAYKFKMVSWRDTSPKGYKHYRLT